LNDVARLRQTCRVLREGVDACMNMKRTVAGEGEKSLDMSEDIPWQLMAWKRDWTRNPWATWVARGDMRRERPDMTRALSRCDLAAVRVGSDPKETLLHVASCYGHAGMVMLLLGKGVDKDKGNIDGRTPLFFACFHGHVEVVRLLVAAGADKDKAEHYGVTPLYIASQNGHLEIVRLLVDAGADKDKARHDDSTPLYNACGEGHLEIVRLLVEAGADKDKADDDGVTPLQIARWSHHDEIVEMLQRAGATG
jgi:ankyrin repeat protein